MQSSRCSSAAASVGVGHHARRASSAATSKTSSGPAGGRDDRRGVGPADHAAAARCRRPSSRATSSTDLVRGRRRRPRRRRAAAAPARRPRRARRRRRAGTRRAGRRPSPAGRPAATGPSGASSRIAPPREQPRGGAERSVSTSARSTPSPSSRSADEPRAGEPARHVVLQVGVEEAVARVQLGRRADAEHRDVERVEPEPLAGLGEPRVGVGRGARRRRATAPARRRCRGRGARPRRRRPPAAARLDGGPQALVEEVEGRPRRAQPSGMHAPPPRLRAPARRPAARPSAGPSSARPAAGPCARPRARSARCRRGVPGRYSPRAKKMSLPTVNARALTARAAPRRRRRCGRARRDRPPIELLEHARRRCGRAGAARRASRRSRPARPGGPRRRSMIPSPSPIRATSWPDPRLPMPLASRSSGRRSTWKVGRLGVAHRRPRALEPGVCFRLDGVHRQPYARLAGDASPTGRPNGQAGLSPAQRERRRQREREQHRVGRAQPEPRGRRRRPGTEPRRTPRPPRR